MFCKANLFVVSKSTYKAEDGRMFYNASVIFDGESDSRRVSVAKDFYPELVERTDYYNQPVEIRSGVSKSGSPYVMVTLIENV